MSKGKKIPVVETQESRWKVVRREVFSAILIACLLWACRSLTEMQVNIAKMTTDVSYLVEKVDDIEDVNDDQATCLLDHERRLVYLETIKEKNR